MYLRKEFLLGTSWANINVLFNGSSCCIPSKGGQKNKARMRFSSHWEIFGYFWIIIMWQFKIIIKRKQTGNGYLKRSNMMWRKMYMHKECFKQLHGILQASRKPGHKIPLVARFQHIKWKLSNVCNSDMIQMSQQVSMQSSCFLGSLQGFLSFTVRTADAPFPFSWSWLTVFPSKLSKLCSD